MLTVLHVLPHPGGGAETYLAMLGRMEDVAHTRISLSGTRSPLSAAPSIVMCWPVLAVASRRADIVHVHGDVAAVLTLPMLRGVPVVWTTHGLHFLRRAKGPLLRHFAIAVRAVVEGTAATICCSSAERDELARILPSRLHDRLYVVPNGVDLPTREEGARAALGLPDDITVALYLGQLEDRKDPLTAVRAANRAISAGARLTLLVAGGGALERVVSGEAGPAVQVLGHRSDTRRLLSAASVFVLPSRREGLSFAVLEAMGHGLAMVVADEPGNREAVGEAAFILPPGDVAAFSEVLFRLARDRGTVERLGAAARARVITDFPAQRLVDSIAAIYAEVAA